MFIMNTIMNNSLTIMNTNIKFMMKYHKRHCFLVDFEVSIALMNLVTAVLVEGALDHARQEKETLGVIRGGPMAV